MRYLVSCMLVLPFLSSCTVIEEQYYERGYYVPAPRVEVHPEYAPRHHHVHNGYRAVSSNTVYNNGGTAVVINPRRADVAKSNNLHGHSNNAGIVHGHTGNSGTVHGHTNNLNVHGNPGNINAHGHVSPAGNAIVQHPPVNGAVNHVKPATTKRTNQGVVQGHQNQAHGHR